jgi:diguanylate cyclase (GGDEF)-like protein
MDALDPDKTVPANTLGFLTEGVLFCDAQWRVETANPAAVAMMALPEAALVGRPLYTLLQPSTYLRSVDPEHQESSFHTGTVPSICRVLTSAIHRHVLLRTHKTTDNGTPRCIAILENTQAALAEITIDIDPTERDHLTGLRSRASLLRTLQNANPSSDPQQPGCLAIIDLDNFLVINQALGQQTGDVLIMEIANGLRSHCTDNTTLYRIGADTFAILFEALTVQDAMDCCEELRTMIAVRPYASNDDLVNLTASIGLGAGMVGDSDSMILFSRAESACTAAKREGRNCVRIFRCDDGRMEKTVAAQIECSVRLRRALACDEFILKAEPIVDVTRGEVHAFEALLRIPEPHSDWNTPGEFLPIAEKFGLMSEIDLWVVRKAVAWISSAGNTLRRLSINLSPFSLSNPSLGDKIERIIKDGGIDPTRLIIEVTETSTINNMSAAVSFLERMRRLGCKTALDDFGTGMSSFAYLRNLPVNYLKIDGQFIREIDRNQTDQALVRAIVDIAHTLRITTIAEYVSSPEIEAVLLGLGVDLLQGDHMSMQFEKQGFPASIRGHGHRRLKKVL